MSADLLRRAAALMRMRADEATPGPWGSDDEYVHSQGLLVAEARGSIAAAEAQHIASWHPAVAPAVADWLLDTARYWDAVDAAPAYMEGDPASVVARAYLGES